MTTDQSNQTISARLKNFRDLATHPWYARLFKTLPEADKKTCEEFIRERDGLPNHDYCSQVLRWGVDRKIDSKNYYLMNELLLVAGTMEFKK